MAISLPVWFYLVYESLQKKNLCMWDIPLMADNKDKHYVSLKLAFACVVICVC